MKRININTKIKILDKIINKFFKSDLEMKYLNSFYRETPSLDNLGNNKILIYAGIGHMYITPLEVLMYHLFIDRGFKVDYSIYDENIPINEVITRDIVKNYGKEKFWNRSVKNARDFLKYSRVDYDYIEYDARVKTILDKNAKNIESMFKFEYEGIKFGQIVKSVLYRYYKSFSLGNDALNVGKKFMYTSLTNYFYLKKKLEQNKYKYIVFSHGIYCTWAPISSYCDLIGQDYICYDRAKTKGYINFNLNKPAPIWDISYAWSRMSNYQLNFQELKKVDKYLSERELQKGDVFSYNFKQKEKDLELLRSRYNIKAGAKVLTFFTNLIWDAANVARDIAFDNVMECIIKTIERYKDINDIHILLRPHPAEQVLGTNERYEDILIKEYDNMLPSNVSIIKIDDKINSFSVIEISDIGIIHTSTVGIEMAIEGKPTILISDTHYRNKGFTYDAISEDNFFELVDGILRNGHEMPKQIELAKKYFYLMMFEYQHKIPLQSSSINSFDGYGHGDFKSLKFDKNEKINLIIDRITNGDFSDFIFKNVND